MDIYFTGRGNDGCNGLHHSPTGSLISITSEHDPHNFNNDYSSNKLSENEIVNEEWWRTTLQVSIPFLIAGCGTIGAGILLGVVEVSFIRLKVEGSRVRVTIGQ